MNDNSPRTGRTTRQIRTAQPGSFFIVATKAMENEARTIAYHEGRPDLDIINLHQVQNGSLRGMTSRPWVMDHHCHEFMRGMSAQDVMQITHELQSLHRNSAGRGLR